MVSILEFICFLAIWQSFNDGVVEAPGGATMQYTFELKDPGGLSYWLTLDSDLTVGARVFSHLTAVLQFTRQGIYSRTPNVLFEEETFPPSTQHGRFRQFGPYLLRNLYNAEHPHNIYVVNVLDESRRPEEYLALGLSIPLSYVLCFDADDACQNAVCQDGRSFCLLKGGACQYLRDEVGRCDIHDVIHNHKICRSDGQSFASLCHAYMFARPAQIGRSVLFNSSADCQVFEVYFEDGRNNDPIFVGSYFLRSQSLKIGCHSNNPEQIRTAVVTLEERRNGDVITRSTSQCNKPVALPKPANLSVTKLSITSTNGTSTSFVKLVNFAVNDSHIRLRFCNRTLSCFFNVQLPGTFRLNITVLKEDQESSMDSFQPQFNSKMESTLNIADTGKYVCIVKIRFRGCAPTTTFVHTIKKSADVHSLSDCSDIQPLTKRPVTISTTKSGDEQTDSTLSNLLIVVIAALVPTPVVILIVWYCYFRKKQHQRVADKKAGGRHKKVSPMKKDSSMVKSKKSSFISGAGSLKTLKSFKISLSLPKTSQAVELKLSKTSNVKSAKVSSLSSVPKKSIASGLKASKTSNVKSVKKPSAVGTGSACKVHSAKQPASSIHKHIPGQSSVKKANPLPVKKP